MGAWLVAVAVTQPGWAAELTLVPRDREPKTRAADLSADKLAALRAAVEADPGDRMKRLELVAALRAAGQRDLALEEAGAWRQKDAYNLVVVRFLGDLLSELGRADEALRVYSAVVELLPEDARAHRALGTVLKQVGDLEGAYARLSRAQELSSGDSRIGFELADTAQRLGRTAEARQRFEAILAQPDLDQMLALPARQRLAQILAAARREAAGAGRTEEVVGLDAALGGLQIEGGMENDLKVYLSWDSDGSDVDLWVTSPTGEKVFYNHAKGTDGGRLYYDVTRGYGPESYALGSAKPGTYRVEVNYYAGSSRHFAEARGEVIAVLHEGRSEETRTVLPYRIYRPGQTVTVAEIKVQKEMNR
jgi:Flp pilus assembly protein TadD